MMRNIFAFLGVFLLVSPAFASDADLCLQAVLHYEKEYQIKPKLLEIITRVETGRGKESFPWPWTINAENKSFFYETKAEAVTAAYALRRRGVKSFDVGCMQINMMYHEDAFKSLGNAFDPMTNVEYGARFLKGLRGQHSSWGEAAVRYHSSESKKAKKYEKKLVAMLKTIRENPSPVMIAQLEKEGPFQPIPAPVTEPVLETAVKSTEQTVSTAMRVPATMNASNALANAVKEIDAEVAAMERAKKAADWRQRQLGKYQTMQRERGYQNATLN